MIRHPLSFCPAAVIALAVAACGAELTEPTHGVFLLTDAREYQLPPPSQPPMSMFATISNQTFAAVCSAVLHQGKCSRPRGSGSCV